MMWIATFIFILLGFCFVHGKSIEKNWEIDIYRDQSDWQEDESIISHFGFRYVQIAQFAMLLSFQALLSAIYGYTYGLAYVFWLIIGTAFFGGVLSYYGGMYALRHQGHTLNFFIKQKVGKFWHLISTLLILSLISLLLSHAYHSFDKVYEGILKLPPHLLLVYCGCVVLFFSFCSARQMAVLFSGVGIFTVLTLCYLLLGSKHQISLIEYGADNFLASELKYAFPMAFFVIALGSINCLQGLQASLLSPMIKNEKLGRKIFFGAAVFQGLFLILLNTLIAAWNPSIKDFQLSLMNASSPYSFLQNMAFGAGGKKAMLLIFALSITLFLTFVACMTRLARNLIAETKIGDFKFAPGMCSFVLIVLSVFWLNQYNLKLAHITIATQLIGILSAYILICFLKAENKKYYHVVWPTVLVLTALISYTSLTIFNISLTLSNSIIVSVLLIALISRSLYKHKEAIKTKWQNHLQRQAELRKIRKEEALVKKQKKAEARKLKEEEKNRLKQEKIEAKKEKEQERKKQETLALLIKQDETGGKNLEEQNLEKEIVRLSAERDEIERRIKEVENALEKEQSKRLLLETSESVINKMQDDEEDDNKLISEIEKLDQELTEAGDDVDLGTLIADDTPSEKPHEMLPKFDFEFDMPQENITDDKAQRSQAKNKRNRKKNKQKNSTKK